LETSLGDLVNVAPAAGILALIGLSIYVLVPVITFLRLGIAELKGAAPPAGDTRRP
jgi:hypothetical protein